MPGPGRPERARAERATDVAIVAGALFVADLFLDWQRTSVHLVGATHLEIAHSGWSGWVSPPAFSHSCRSRSASRGAGAVASTPRCGWAGRGARRPGVTGPQAR